VLASYCAEHYALVYARGTRLGRRVKDLRRAEEIRQIVSLFNQAVEELEAEGFDCYGESELGLDLDKETF
jgi:coproporphyrinogen III oxidase-like Fe-S oxidoreductase